MWMGGYGNKNSTANGRVSSFLVCKKKRNPINFHYRIDNEKQMYNLAQPRENDAIYKLGWFNDFRGRMRIHGLKEAVNHAWEDFKDLCGGSWYNWKKLFHEKRPSKDAKEIQTKYFEGYGTIDGVTVTKESLAQMRAEGRPLPEGRFKPGRISYLTYLRMKDKVDPPTRLNEGDRLASWGPQTESGVLGRYESWDSYDQYRTEQLTKTWPIPDKPTRVWIKDLRNITHHIELATERAQVVTSVLFPILSNWVVKSAVMSMFSTWTGSDSPREGNEMGLQFLIQESSKISRMALKETVNRVVRSEVVAEDGKFLIFIHGKCCSLLILSRINRTCQPSGCGQLPPGN